VQRSGPFWIGEAGRGRKCATEGSEGVGSRGYRYGTERRSLAVKERLGEMRFVTARKGSRGTDVMGRVGCGAAGSLQWTGEIGYETERERSGRNLQRFGEAWSHPVWQSRNGPDIFGGAG
jgi:hypothetical protein